MVCGNQIKKLGFNGAVLFRVRKLIKNFFLFRAEKQASMEPYSFEYGNVLFYAAKLLFLSLQWSRTLSSTETFFECLISSNYLLASMEPYSFEYGNLHIPPPRRCLLLGFNGAVLFRVRKRRAQMTLQKYAQRLQWSRTLSSTETHQHRLVYPTYTGFNGAVLFRVRKQV